MNKVYNFNWVTEKLYNNYVLSVYDKSQLIGIYQADRILTNGLDNLSVRFANIDDLTNFASHSIVRFTQIINNNNFLDLPIRNLYMLNDYSTDIGENDKFLDRNTLEISGVYDNELLRDPITISIHKISEPEESLSTVMNITKDFNNLGMNEKINALEKINLLNYQICKEEN